MQKFLPLVGVLVFGIAVIKILIMLSGPWLNRDATALDVIGLVSLFVGMCALLSFYLSKTKLFADKE